MPRRIETLFLSGPAGRLEGLLEEPEDAPPTEAAVVCHPHPLFGGTMHNKVVYRLARALRASGCVVLRFNFRGVNLSEGQHDDGVGETEDARTALQALQERYGSLPLLAAGFSFGARVTFRLAADEPRIGRVIGAGFPTRLPHKDFAFRVHAPKYIVQSTADQFGPRPAVEEFFEKLPEPKHIDWIEAADHFFDGSLDAFEAAILRIGKERVG